MFQEFANRSYKLEHIDTGDYTVEEYEQFLIDIRLVNRFAGDNWALKKSLLRDVLHSGIDKFSVLDIGAGSGELLRSISRFAESSNKEACLTGLELNERSAQSILEESYEFGEISAVQSDALELPFEKNSFDYVICSLFIHHFREKDIEKILLGMSRVARRKIFVIDLHRHPAASFMYKIFCAVFVKGKLVKKDGALSILRGFKPSELLKIAVEANLNEPEVTRHFPFRLVLEANALKE